MKKDYFKYSRTINGGWIKERLTQNVYEIRIDPIDCIVLKSGHCWEIREKYSYLGIITGYSLGNNTRKAVIEEAKKLFASKTQEEINTARLWAEEYKIKFARLPINEEVLSINELLTDEDNEKLNWIYSAVS